MSVYWTTVGLNDLKKIYKDLLYDYGHSAPRIVKSLLTLPPEIYPETGSATSVFYTGRKVSTCLYGIFILHYEELHGDIYILMVEPETPHLREIKKMYRK